MAEEGTGHAASRADRVRNRRNPELAWRPKTPLPLRCSPRAACFRRACSCSLPPGPLQLLVGDARRGRKALVFCGSVDSCRAVEHAVREAELSCVCYHGEMQVQARQEAMAR